MKNDKYENIVAGPCAAENHDQVLTTATLLKEVGITSFRAGLWKPRSSYGTFEGVGTEGIPWMKEVQELGLKVLTEVALPKHVEAVLKADFDMLWIGARTVVNPFLMNELAEALKGVQIPIFIKNPMCPDMKLWLGGVERLRAKNVNNLCAIFRGFCLVDNGPYRNAPLWDYSEKFSSTFPEIPVYCDLSHIAGKRELLLELGQEAVKRGFDKFFLESHFNPDIALSDSKQQLVPADLKILLDKLLTK